MKLFKKSVSLLLALVLSLGLTMTVSAQSAGDGSLLPLRYLFEALGGENIYWDQSERMVILTHGGTEARLWLDNSLFQINDTEGQLENPAVLRNDRTHVPLSFIESVLDVASHLDNASMSVFVADEADLDTIAELMSALNASDHPAMSAVLSSNMQVLIDVDGFSETSDVQIHGTLKIDPANRFQHVYMTTSMLGMDMVSEVFDDGDFMYVVVDGMVLRMMSAFELSDNLVSQYMPIGQDIGLSYYGLQLAEGDDALTISGVMIIPEEYFNEFFASLSDFGDFIPGIEDIDMDIRFNAPIGFSVVFDRESSLMTSMEIHYDMEITMTVEGETVFMHMVYTIIMSNIVYGAEFDTVVPVEIIEAAIPFDTLVF
ncbi:MAG: stalk domain-containing protein [Defluviitaleaceae bacterium]|nr:stalk domain-containing protein [Defluviitaleaceae bacterium]